MKEELCNGVVTKLKEFSITIACEDVLIDELENKSLFVKQLTNDITYKRLFDICDVLERYNGINTSFLPLRFSENKTPEFENKLIIPFESTVELNESQKNAIEKCLKAREIGIIHGPPGTGKTTTIVELIRQFNIRNKRVLACAPSNIAVDNIIELLTKRNEKENNKLITRLGHPARINDKIKKYSLDYKMLKSDENDIFDDIYKEMNEINKEIKKNKDKNERKRLYGELKSLRKELSKRQEKSINSIIKESLVICSTCIGAGLKVLKNENFDVVIIDECGQSIELLCYIPILKGKIIILAGDHLQLPPTILCEKNKSILEKSLLEVLANKYENECVFMLNTQYRMNEIISNWSSECLYNNNLLTYEENKNITISNITNKNKNDDKEKDDNKSEKDEKDEENDNLYPPMVFIDTTGCNFDESVDEDDSKYNVGEISIVIQYINRLILLLGIKEENIGIISPYHAEVCIIKEKLINKYPQIEINSVDGFQGREKEIIILSLVRSNEMGEIGFLKEYRRINVAITRAKRHICIIGDINTVGRNKFIKNLIEYVEANGLIYNGNDFIHSEDFELIEIENYKSNYNNNNNNNTKSNTIIKTKDKNNKDKNNNKNTKKEIKMNEKVIKENKEIKVENEKEEKNKEIEIENTKEYKQYYNIISAFIKTQKELENNNEYINIDNNNNNNSNVIFSFPKSLSNYERLLVHKISEKLKIESVSKGEGKDRYISIIYHKNKKEKNENKSEIKQQQQQQQSPPPPASTETSIQQPPPPLPIPPPQSLSTNKNPKIKTKINEKNNNNKTKEKGVSEDDDFDEIIKNAEIGVSKCGVKGCKSKNVVLLGGTCRYCKLRYCFSHMQAEIHGCGEIVRKIAREEFKENVINKPKKYKDYQHNAIKNEFNKKLLDKMKDRSKKKKKENK